MTAPMNRQLLGSFLLSLGMLSACAENASQDGDGPADATGGRNPMEEVLPPDVEILGTCTVDLVWGFCDLYYRPAGTKLFDETKAHDACRDIGDDIVWNRDWWSTDNACPTAVLESACRFDNHAEFKYSSASSTLDEDRSSCDLRGGMFFEF